MESLSDKILQKIKEEKIVPKPRWRFRLRDGLVWLLFAASVLVGAVAFGVILFVFLSNDWNLYKYLQINPVEHFVFSLPYLWVAALLVFLALAYYNYKHTENGYRHETYVIVGLSVLASVVLGLIFHFAFGMGEKIDTALSANLPVYARIHAYCNRQNIWSQPERGLLGGVVRKVSSDDEFEIEDFRGSIWQVEQTERILMPGGFLVVAGRKVKLIGEKRAERLFRVREIWPWQE